MAEKLTIVSASRNDGYGERAEERLRFHLATVVDFARGTGMAVDHVVVDWNPVGGASLEDRYFDIGCADPLFTRRWLPVAGSDVEAAVTAAGRPFLTGAANTAGIAAADGDWVLVLNADIALDFGTGFVVGNALRRVGAADVFVRADRVDVHYSSEEAIPDRLDIADALCRAVRIHRRHSEDWRAISPQVTRFTAEEIALLASTPRLLDRVLEGAFLCTDLSGPLKGLHTNAAGDFILARKSTWERAGGFVDDLGIVGHADALTVAALAAAGARQMVLAFPSVAVHVDHDALDAEEKYEPFELVQSRLDELLAVYTA